MEKNKGYCIYKLIEINFGDPISSMLMTPDHLILGTMLGRIFFFTLSTKNLSILSEFNPENISNISYNSEDNIVNISIGDGKIYRYKEDKNNSKNFIFFQKVLNYTNEVDHAKYCENAFIYLSSHFLFRIQLSQPEEKCLNIIEIENEYEIMNINNNEAYHLGRLPMTNYIVPFCFDGENFAWVEFTGADKRNICIANGINNFMKPNTTNNIITPYKKNIDTSFGHISHLKILDQNKIFLVHSLNICEIWDINNNFNLLESFQHIGDEVYAVDIYYNDEYNRYINREKEPSDINVLIVNNNLEKINMPIKDNTNDAISKINEEKSSENNKNKLKANGKNSDETFSNNDKDSNNFKEDKLIEKSKTEFITQKIKQKNNDNNGEKNNKIFLEKNSSDNSEFNKSLENNLGNKESKKNVKFKNFNCDSELDVNLSFSIITLDIDGNVNLYQYGEERTLFNLYNFTEIPQKTKNDRFFSMGYEYYIKSNLNFFCISTDQGCYIIKKNF